MHYIPRHIEASVQNALNRDKSVILFGARQTGKTTLTKHLQSNLVISLAIPEMRRRYELNPSLLIPEIEAINIKTKLPLIIIDEIQKVPDLLDAVQYLIDEKKAIFILTGSSARKLKHNSKLNLLPGRVVALKLDPLALSELNFATPNLEDLLIYGSLPGIITVSSNDDREIDLESYVTIYLEEEIRAEACVRNLSSFTRFLELAATESGNIVNLSKLSQEIGVAHTTIAAYYQILEDCLIAERIDPFLKTKTRRKLNKTPKYLFFDLGLRRIAAREGNKLPIKYMGLLFEQFIGLELIKQTHFAKKNIKIRFWRDLKGPEIDWIIDSTDQLTPIETKWTDTPSLKDAKHLQLFLNEYPEAKNAFIVCRTPRRMKLSNNIYAIPWQELTTVFNE